VPARTETRAIAACVLGLFAAGVAPARRARGFRRLRAPAPKGGRMTRKDRALATEFSRRIAANVDDFHEERIDYETFSERQRGLWTTLDAAGPEVKRAVLEDTIWRLAEDSDLVLHPSINEHT